MKKSPDILLMVLVLYELWLFIVINRNMTAGTFEDGVTMKGKKKVSISLGGNIPLHENSVCILLITSELKI